MSQSKSAPTKRGIITYVAALCSVTLLIIGLMFWKLSNIADTNKSTLTELRACIDVKADGDCAEKGQANQAQAIQVLVCNQEKIAYLTYPNYNPPKECYDYIAQATGEQVVPR